MSFSFGTPSSAPATSSLAGGFNFSGNKPSTPGFGLTSTSQSSTGLFGSTATSTPAFGSTATPSFGATTTPAFGSTTTPAFGATPSLFGAATTTVAPAFGTSTVTPAFGATSTLGATPGTGLGTGGLNFGTGTSAPSTGLSFGAPAATQASTGLGGFGFGTATTTQSGFSLFNNASTATTNTGGLFGLGGGAKLGALNTTGTQPSISAAPSLGLGGISTTANIGLGTTNTASGDGKNEPPKQVALPNEISTTVESFKEFVKKQKSLSSDIMRVSIKPLHKVARDAEDLLRSVLALSGEVGKSRAQSKRLRTAGANALVAAETAGRDPPGTMLEGFAPPAYIKDLISELEQQLVTFRRQMDVADKQMQASPKLLTEQELTLGIRRMHESLVALAGRLQAVHTQVEAQKEQYLNLRKYVLKDPSNVFECQSGITGLDQILQDAEGYRKKTKTSGVPDLTQGSAVLADPKAALSNIQHLAGPSPFTYFGSGLSNTPIAENSVASWQPQPQTTLNPALNTSFGSFGSTDVNSSFNLQKPPGKRGKQ